MARNKREVKYERYKCDLGYVYPENIHQHMIDPAQTHKNDLDANYPYYNTTKWYKFKRVMMHIFVCTIGRLIIWLRYKPKIYDKENYLKNRKELDKGFVTVCNHVYEWDFLTLRYALWQRKGYVLLWHNNHNRKIGNMIHNFGSVPIPRDDTGATIKMFRDVNKMLNDGQWLNIYAEEAMWYFYQGLREFREGAFYMACTADRPVLPMCLSFRPARGLCKLWKRKYPNVNVSFGEPLYPNHDLPMRDRIKDLLERTYNSVKEQMDKYTPMVPAKE